MAYNVLFNFLYKVADVLNGPSGANHEEMFTHQDLATGYQVQWPIKVPVIIANGANKTLTFANMGFPTGAKVEWAAFITYTAGTVLADQFVTLTIDAAATDSQIGKLGSGRCATSLKFANASGADVTIDFFAFVRVS